MPTAVVTGATGFVGSHLVDLLLATGYSVKAAVRRTSNRQRLSSLGVEQIEVDFADERLSLPPCDILFHVAGVIQATSWQGYLEGNHHVTRRVLGAAKTSRFIHVSTLAVAGPHDGAREETPPAPISYYGKSKLLGENEVLAHRNRVPVTVIRPPVVYGPRDRALLDMYRVIARGIIPEIGGRKVISVVHVRDLVEGMVRAGESSRAANQILFIGNEKSWEISRLMELIRAILGRRALRIRVPDRIVRFLGGLVEDAGKWMGIHSIFGRDKALEMTQAAWTCSSEKARNILGWNPEISVEDGMTETLSWCRAEKLL